MIGPGLAAKQSCPETTPGLLGTGGLRLLLGGRSFAGLLRVPGATERPDRRYP